MKRLIVIAALTLASVTLGYRSSQAQLDPVFGGPLFGRGEDGDGTGGVRSPPSGRFTGECSRYFARAMCAQCERWPYNEKCVWACDGGFDCRWLTGGICHIPAHEKFCRSTMFR